MGAVLGTFPMVFSQATTSQGYFPKRQLPKGIFPSDNLPNVQKRQLPKFVIAAALGSLARPNNCSAGPQL